ncbi:MAG: TIGR04283 family arsenosugar biosynthesis glycosyltransferase [Verrucomicrobiales bacterium]|nr:TIGR04283 family arsenosugar biosynthesis glycosyltransferase [Verrucomicrobiales bacterium]
MIPVLNEVNGLEETVRRVRRVAEVREIIVVDGGSHDGTQALARSLGCSVFVAAPGRGGQMRLGAQQATADVVWLLHADTWVESDAGEVMLQCLRDPAVVAGGFWKRFRETRLLLLGSRFRCAVRVWIGRRIVGDMAMFIRREVLEQIGGVPDMELMEDFELSHRLRKVGRLALADGVVTTSARRFIEKGVLSTYFKMWQITMLYRLGRSPAELRRRYG